eukprot:11160715-Lingulodinium_polyedra.AAC.1
MSCVCARSPSVRSTRFERSRASFGPSGVSSTRFERSLVWCRMLVRVVWGERRSFDAFRTIVRLVSSALAR